MNHGHYFDMALSAERKAEQERKQAEREARKKLEAAAPDLLDACKDAVSILHNNTEWLVKSGFPDNSLVARAEEILKFEQAITKATQ